MFASRLAPSSGWQEEELEAANRSPRYDNPPTIQNAASADGLDVAQLVRKAVGLEFHMSVAAMVPAYKRDHR